MAVIESDLRVPDLASQEERIIDAALRCIARWGVAKTTLDDVAREADYSRATVYRFFPGGRDGLIETVTRTEVSRFFAALGQRLASATDLESMLVDGITEAARRLDGHAALQFLLAHEPETVVPKLAFTQMDQVLATTGRFAAPYFARFVGEDRAERAVEWVARIVLSYSSCPADGVDLTDEDSVRRLVRTFVLPGLLSPTRAH